MASFARILLLLFVTITVDQLLVHSAPTTLSNVKDSVLCDVCELLVATVRKLTELHVSEDLIVKAAIKICEERKIEDNYICSLIVPEFKDEVLYVFDHVALSSREICNTVLHNKCNGGTYDPFNQTWNVTIPDNKPPIQPYVAPSDTAPTNRILHISDIHWDPLYTPGLQAACPEPMCCRPPMKDGGPDNSAGYWGDIHCDLPYVTLVNLMEHLNKTSDQFDWIYLTGDLPSHSDWTQNSTGQKAVLKTIVDLFDKYLPDKPLFFSFGNHESAPVNSFPPTSLVDKDHSITWLYDEATGLLKKWINTPEALATFDKGGFYSIDFKGFRIISLQTNYCNNENWWLLINSTDPDGMLKWFVEQLTDAEQKGMKVHILGHIPPSNSDCTSVWANIYKRAIHRFENIVVGQFFGHVHSDRVVSMVDFDTKPPRAYGTIYLGPSVTSYTFVFPGYRIYTVDGTYNDSSRTVLDHETYIMNITDANLTNEPKWVLEYSVKKDYKVTNLSHASWLDLLINKFSNDHDLFMKYYHYTAKSRDMNAVCTGSCQHSTICSAITTYSKVQNPCGIIPSNTVTQEDMVLYHAAHDYC